MKMLLVYFFLIESIYGNGQIRYAHDRVYTANQVSNSVSVIDPSHNKLIGEIKLGKPYPDVLSALYRGQALVHGLRYAVKRKMLAVVSIGSNAVTLISTEDNHIIATIYIGRAPHEPVFTFDEKQLWVSVRGEAYISVIDLHEMKEVKRVPVADGPGMVAFTADGKLAYVCSSFTAELDIVSTLSLQVIKRIPVTSPFSPNIFTSPDGQWIALTHKDVGKVTVVNTASKTVEIVIPTGAITNHVTFSRVQKRLLMFVTVGGENKVRIFDVAEGFRQCDSIMVGALPHGIWTSGDGVQLYVGLEYGDQVQRIDLVTRRITSTIGVGQSPQALVYAENAVSDDINGRKGLTQLNDTSASQVLVLNNTFCVSNAQGRLVIRNIGLADLVEQSFNGLKPNTAYTLALSASATVPFESSYAINSFTTDRQGKYLGQSTGVVNTLDKKVGGTHYKRIILVEDNSNTIVLTSGPVMR